MMGSAAALGRILLLLAAASRGGRRWGGGGTTLLVAAEPDAPSPAVAAHAARAALAALADIDSLEAEALEVERQKLHLEKANPLETYPAVNVAMGHLLEACLCALRYCLAAGVVASPKALIEMAALDDQLSSLLNVQAKEPLFFWHGWKWHVLAKLRRVFEPAATAAGVFGTSPREELAKLAAATSTGREAFLGAGRSREKKVEKEMRKPIIRVPSVGVAVDASACPGGPSSCSLALLTAASAVASGPAHLLVLPSERSVLQTLGKVIGKVHPEPMLSVALPLQDDEEFPQNLFTELKAAVTALGRIIDLLWLPYAAFKKYNWPEVKELLEQFIEQGQIKAYGIQTEVRSGALVTKLLGRTPKPAAWLMEHDVLRPIEQEAAAAARALGVTVVALQRVRTRPVGVAVTNLEVVSPDPVGQVAAEQRWTLQQGLATVVRAASPAPKSSLPTPKEVLERLKTTPDLSDADARVLEAVRPFSRPGKADAGSEGLEAALQRGQQAMLQASEGVATPPPTPSSDAAPDPKQSAGAPAVPGISDFAMSDLDSQREQYKENNHVIYRPGFFDAATYAAIKEETVRLWKSYDVEPNCNLDGVNRLGGYVLDHTPQNTSLYRLIYGNEAFRRWVSIVNGEGEMWPSDFPLEIREYGTESSGMGCHPDLQMYAVPRKDLEFAFTVDNDSRCNVTFYNKAGEVKTIQTKANSMMMVRVNAATHCVSPTEGGTRTILKFIFVGDYRKSNEFWRYSTNRCGAQNANRVKMQERREERGAETAAHAGAFEL